MFALAVVSLLLVASGSVMIFKPDTYYRICESWKNGSDTEPSDLYKIYTRIGGGISIVLGLFFLIVSVLALMAII